MIIGLIVCLRLRQKFRNRHNRDFFYVLYLLTLPYENFFFIISVRRIIIIIIIIIIIYEHVPIIIVRIIDYLLVQKVTVRKIVILTQHILIKVSKILTRSLILLVSQQEVIHSSFSIIIHLAYKQIISIFCLSIHLNF